MNKYRKEMVILLSIRINKVYTKEWNQRPSEKNALQIDSAVSQTNHEYMQYQIPILNN